MLYTFKCNVTGHSCQNGSYDGSQNMFLWREMANCPEIICYLFSAETLEKKLKFQLIRKIWAKKRQAEEAGGGIKYQN